MELPRTIETDRLQLRRWRESDREPFAAMNADQRVMEFFPKQLSTDESHAYVSRIGQHFDEHGFGLWAVEVKNVAPFVGFIGLAIPQFPAHFTPCVEIGWRLAAEHWGCGYAAEGALSVLEFAFSSLRLEEVVAMTAARNQRSQRVMEKIGMTHSADDDFDHPLLPGDHELSRHVLYRIQRTSVE